MHSKTTNIITAKRSNFIIDSSSSADHCQQITPPQKQPNLPARSSVASGGTKRLSTSCHFICWGNAPKSGAPLKIFIRPVLVVLIGSRATCRSFSVLGRIVAESLAQRKHVCVRGGSYEF